jgi:hypothetical protein
MFRYYRPAQHWEPKEFRETCDLIDAQRIEKVVSTLPPTFAFALRWLYVYRFSAATARRELATTYDGMHQMVRDGRQMVLNLVD